MIYNDFIDNVLPGNYALTKSMELTKIQSSGTLWYIKKFLVLYYYIFLTNEILTREYIAKIVDSFNKYIDSLDSSVKKTAEDFFFTTNPATDFRSTDFKTFNSFIDYTGLDNAQARENYDRTARKYYFALLMGVGGQTGVKKELKQKIQESSFVYSDLNIQKSIDDSVIKICKEQVNETHIITDNSIKYFLSQEAIKNIVKLSNQKIVNENDIINISKKYPLYNPRYNSIKNDLVAFLRNERQILFYYGFFHSKSSGANDYEFSSLTPVGHAALNANSNEFLVIWEHQKLKMISQPITADINNIPTNLVNANKFSISYTPYLNILNVLKRRNQFTKEEYMYIVSRMNRNYSEEQWLNAETDIFSHLEEIKLKVRGFGRDRDTQYEDGYKELLKYLLGIRADLPLDRHKNLLNIVRFKNNEVELVDSKALCDLLNIYSKLSLYKVRKYEKLFNECENDLKKRYIASSSNSDIKIDPQAKIKWDIYNIHQDKFIILTLIFYFSSCALKLDFLNASKSEKNDIANYAINNYKNLLKSYSLKTPNKTKNVIDIITSTLISEVFDEFIDDAEGNDSHVIATFKEESSSDLLMKIQEISLSSATLCGERTRNTNLINLLKSYYLSRFLENNLLKCECCGEETFIATSGEPYVEFHHLIPFNIALGPDHYLNLYALCPNCHRKIHFLSVNDKENEYKKIDFNNYLEKTIVERLHELKKERILCSYHLEYLLAEKAINQTQYDFIAA